eukprot:Gb_35615 [translate_table: standard]
MAKWSQSTICLVLLLLHLNGENGENSISEMEWEEEIKRQWSILDVEDGLTKKTTCIKFAAWRLSVEANNARDWKEVISQYKSYTEYYMIKGQYMSDSRVAIDEVLKYLNTLTLGGNDMDTWILDVGDIRECDALSGEALSSEFGDGKGMQGIDPLIMFDRHFNNSFDFIYCSNQ